VGHVAQADWRLLAEPRRLARLLPSRRPRGAGNRGAVDDPTVCL